MNLSQMLTKPAYGVSGVLEIVPISRSRLYEEVKAGRLRATKLGRRTIFLADDVVRWLKTLREVDEPLPGLDEELTEAADVGRFAPAEKPTDTSPHANAPSQPPNRGPLTGRKPRLPRGRHV